MEANINSKGTSVDMGLILSAVASPVSTAEKVKPPLLNSHDVVLHPTKEWPFIGVVQNELTIDSDDWGATDDAATCRCFHCGREKTTTDDCHYDDGGDGEGDGSDMADSASEHDGSAIGVRINPEFSHYDSDAVPTSNAHVCGTQTVSTATDGDSAATCQCAVSITANNVTSLAKEESDDEHRWSVVWHPGQLRSAVDGSEVTMVSGKQLQIHSGISVCKTADLSERRGIVKMVNCRCAAVILPECKYVITNVNHSQCLGSPLEEAQNVDVYAIKGDWLGSVYQIQRKVYFRCEADGRQFSKIDTDYNGFDLGMCEYVSGVHTSFDPNTLFEGQTLVCPHSMLANCEWLIPAGFVADQDLTNKINSSQSFWMYPESDAGPNDECWRLPRDGGNNGAVQKSDEIRSRMASVDRINLSVIKVELVKVCVDWKYYLASSSTCDGVGDRPIPPPLSELSSNDIAECSLIKVPRFNSLRSIGHKFGYKITDKDQIVPVNQWRRQLLQSIPGFVLPKVEDLKASEQTSEISYFSDAMPSVGTPVSVYQLLCDTDVMVIWEDNETEYGVKASSLCMPPISSDISGRDFYPAMYVSLSANASKTMTKDADRTLFGLITSANNKEKCCSVNWFSFEGVESGTPREPIPVQMANMAEVSFYDIKPHSEYNYMSSCLIRRVTPVGCAASSVQNVGYVIRKQIDGSVLVRFYGDDSDSVVFPWHIEKLRSSSGCADYPDYCSENGTQGGGDGYYSPSENEFDAIEDLRHFNYEQLTEEDRYSRVGLISELLHPTTLLIRHAIIVAASSLPFLERRQLVKMCLHCDDIISGYAHISRFESIIKSVLPPVEGNGGRKKAKNRFKDDMDGHNQAVWHMSTWLYDWLEVTNELDSALRSLSTTGSEEPQAAVREKGDVLLSMSVDKLAHTDPACSAISATEGSVPPRVQANLSSWLALVQASLTMVSQIVAQGSNLLSCARLVKDCIDSTNAALNAISPELLGSNGDDLRMDNSASIPRTKFFGQELSSSFAFIDRFHQADKRIARLHCFNYSLPTSGELRRIVDSGKWRTYALSDTRQPYEGGASHIGSPESSSAVIETVIGKAEKYIASVTGKSKSHKSKLAPSQIDATQVVSNCILLADAMSTSVLTILWAINGAIRKDLAQYTKPLFASVVNSAVSGATGGNSVNSVDGSHSSVMDIDDSHARVVNEDHYNDVGPLPSLNCFEMLEQTPATHRFIGKQFDANGAPKGYLAAARKEMKLLRSSLPPGIYVKAYEDRIDLLSCMMVGPVGTPYAYGLFLFDVRLKDDYPRRPPHVFFRSMSKRLNPNLYVDGMVCLSLLGTWDGNETELWTASSNLLQVFVSIQSLVLVAEPYYCEPGFESERGTEAGMKKSRDYNESALLLTLESLYHILIDPPTPFVDDIRAYYIDIAPRLLRMLDDYQSLTDDADRCCTTVAADSFPLRPVTQGFRLCIKRHRDTFAQLYESFISHPK